MNQTNINHFRKAFRQTPFHARITDLCTVNDWGVWKGYTVVNTVDEIEFEYFAIRNSCSVFDLTPMSKYRIRGKDADIFMNRLVTRNIGKLKVGRVGYAIWCNDRGKIIDDGTIFHLSENDYRLCAQERQLDWLLLSSLGFDVDIVEETHDVASLAVQGPTSCAVLKDMGLDGIDQLKPFGISHFPFEGGDLMVSRTGFTGDLGYEFWIDPSLAEPLWDRLFDAGRNRHIRAIGGHALDMSRIEAGFIQAGVDFMPAHQTVRLDHDRSPFELGLDWLVDLTKPNFTGKRALLKEKQEGSRLKLVRLNIEGNKPAHDAYIYRGKNGKHVGNVTSAMWSPTCKANIGLALVDRRKAGSLDDLWVEIFYQRDLKWHKVSARCEVVEGAFWDPPRRRATPPADY